MNEIIKMSALELGTAIREKRISTVQAVNAYLESIKELNPVLNCYITVCEKEALERAAQIQKEIECGRLRGRLAGVPVAIKDNICTKGIRTTCASKMLENFIPDYDATVIERIKAEGMIILGKLNMDEFAMGSTGETSYFGAVRNPWNTEKSAGGSSSGSAAAVAAGLAPIALGSDTGGSVRQPASYCGVTGLKPTYSAVSRYGLIAYASSFDQIGIISRNAEDCAALFEIISGTDSKDITCNRDYAFSFEAVCDNALKGKKIGIANEYLNDELNTDIRDSVILAAERFEALGAQVGYFELPEAKYFIPSYYVIACAEMSSNLARYDGVRFGHRSLNARSIDEFYINSRTEGFGDEVKKRILLGNFVLSAGYYDAYYKKAIGAKELITTAFNRAFETYDYILSPVVPDTAPELGKSSEYPLEMYLSDIYTVAANLAGIPAIAIPVESDKSGMPVGFQLMGKRFSEVSLLSAAKEFENSCDCHKKVPFGREADL